jgi:lipoprotein-anchoring transpeptidase ErfK/SrfK
MAVRQLSGLYLTAASAFTVAIVLSQHPTLNYAAHEGAHLARAGVVSTAVALNDYVLTPGWHLTRDASVSLYRSAMKDTHPVVQQRMAAKAPAKELERAPRGVIAKASPKQQIPSALRPSIAEAPPSKPDQQVASTTRPDFTLVPQAAQNPAPPSVIHAEPNAAPLDHPPSAAELLQIEQHFRTSLTKEMLANFELFLFVSKADHGSAAQRMYVFQKQGDGELSLLYNWPVSTGRELDEIAPNGAHAPSITPAGYYELDPHRMYTDHFSSEWRQPMPYAMFFNWQNHGFQTGLAIHGATGKDIGLLGERASAGCIHLSPDNAHVLFSLIKADYKGLMPKFAYDKRTATMSNQGVLVHMADGHVEMQNGYKVLVFIENYGGENVVAALF